MQVTKQGHYHIPASADLTRDGYFAVQVLANGQAHHVAVYVADSKADKHVIQDYWPARQRGTHTGLTIDDDQFGPLYKKVGLDLVTEFGRRGGQAMWLEVRYDALELPGQYFSGNVATRDFRKISTVTVGGSIGYHPTIGYHVYINHGPY